MLDVFDIPRSSWYYKPIPQPHKRPSRPLDPLLSNLLTNRQGYSLTLGVRKLSHFFSLNYFLIFNHKKISRHIKILSIHRPKKRKKNPIKKAPAVLFYCPLKSNMRWEADLTHIPYQGGFMYLFSVIDVFDKTCIGYSLSYTCKASDAIDALKMAVLSRFPSPSLPPHHSLTLRLDRGCQFTAHSFLNAARSFNLSIEFCDPHAPNQKPFIESFFASFKSEEVYRNHYLNPAQVSTSWLNYFSWYNNFRPHSSIRYFSPLQFFLSSSSDLPNLHTSFLSSL